MLILNQVFKLVKLLNSEKGAWSIASGLALGMSLGLVPNNILIMSFFVFLLFVFRTNAAAFFLAWPVFTIIALPFDAQLDRLGYWLLRDVAALQPIFTQWYNLPILPWSQFNHTVVAGGLLAGLVLFVPALLLWRFFIGRYRVIIMPKIQNLKIIKWLKATSIYKLYQKYERVRGEF